MLSPGNEWHKSSYSHENGSCVEARRTATRIAVRDSKNPDGPRLHIPAASWGAFLAEGPGVRA